MMIDPTANKNLALQAKTNADKANTTASQAQKSADAANASVEEARQALIRARTYVDEKNAAQDKQIADLKAEVAKLNKGLQDHHSILKRMETQIQALQKKK